MGDLIDPRQGEVRNVLRALGPAMVMVGVGFIAVGMISFFSAFGGMEPPRLFWCAFVGMPLVGIGMSISKFAFFGAAARFLAGETAPVAKDMTNYMVEGTRGSIRDIAAAVGEGFSSASASSVCQCPKCGVSNSTNAHFCSQCGSPLTKSTNCPKCHESIDLHAKFCDHCGIALA
jgi:hypothetical protein